MRTPRPLEPGRAWDYALLLLGRRAMSSDELRAHLRRRSLDAEEIERLLARLEELRLLDDGAFAAAYVRNRAGRRGRLALRQELRRKGVAEPLVEEALADRTDEDQAAAAAALLRKHAWRFVGEGPDGRPAAAARAFAMLARRGYPSEAARTAVGTVLGEPNGAEVD